MHIQLVEIWHDHIALKEDHTANCRILNLLNQFLPRHHINIQRDVLHADISRIDMHLCHTVVLSDTECIIAAVCLYGSLCRPYRWQITLDISD